MAQPQEYIIWRSTISETLNKIAIVLFIILGLSIAGSAAAQDSLPGFIFGLLFGSLGIVNYVLAKKYNDYVVTNRRAMLRRFGKVVREVPLNTPNLVITTGTGSIYTSWITIIQEVDIVFFANGIELLRFRGVDAGKANELFGKLRSLGFYAP